MTWNLVRSNAPAWKLGSVGYWYVRGPLSSPAGSVTSSTVLPPPSLLTVTWQYPVLRPPAAVADTVITLLPKLTGTVAEKDPSAAAVAAATVAGAPVVVSAASTVTADPGVVVPVTVVAETARVLPAAGAVMVTGSAPGAPWAVSYTHLRAHETRHD